MSNRKKIIILTPIKNGEEYIKEFISMISKIADYCIFLDDYSTDNTLKILEEEVPKYFREGRYSILSKKEDTIWDDYKNRLILIQEAKNFNPDWVLFLDIDEYIEYSDIKLLKVLFEEANENLVYSLLLHRIVDKKRNLYDKTMYVTRIFKYQEKIDFLNKRLHFIPIPIHIPEEFYIKTNIRIKHFGSSSKFKRQKRYEKYLKEDSHFEFQSKEDYLKLLDNPKEENILEFNENKFKYTINNEDKSKYQKLLLTFNQN